MRINILEIKYNRLVKKILKKGIININRNGKTKSIFFEKLSFSGKHMPLLTQRKIFYRQAYGEFLTFIRNKNINNIKDFEKNGCFYWKNWADKDGSINLDYGNLWHNFEGVNQLSELEKNLKNRNNNRRLIISSWNPKNLKKLTLPCCHFLYQFYIRDNFLDMIWYQRSADILVGAPYDMLVAYYMLKYFCEKYNYIPGKINMVFGDLHIYENQIKDIKLSYYFFINDKNYKYKRIIKYKIS